MSDSDPAYRRLPTEGPHDPGLGGALITWVEPMPEHVVGYNRWYEDDHMITGAMSMPWMFSCRRFVAPRSVQHLRAPAGSDIAVPLEAGKYIGLYWVNPGRIDDHQQWSLGANNRLHAEGRGSYRGVGVDPTEERRHIFTAFHDFLGATYRDDGVPRARHTLEQHYEGLVVELIRARSTEHRGELDDWLAHDYLPSIVDGATSVVLRFGPRPLPPDKLSHVRELDDVESLVTVLYFLEDHPEIAWSSQFESRASDVAAAGIGSLGLQAAFIPTHHGTNDYVDQLF